MIESVSNKELYEKFHELYIAVIKHIICKITVTRDDGATVDVEMLHRVQEYCLAAFDELNYRIYQRALNEVNVPEEQTSLAVLSYTLLRVLEDREILSIIQEKYKAKLPEEESICWVRYSTVFLTNYTAYYQHLVNFLCQLTI